MARFEVADDEVTALVTELMGKYHPELADEEVEVKVLMVFANKTDKGNSNGPAIKVNGRAAYAQASVYNDRNRVVSGFDCEIQLDADKWPGWTPEQQAALVDHELTHFILRRDKDDAVTYDIQGRPRLAIRKHDYEIGWFHEVAQRHGTSSVERSQFDELLNNPVTKQLYLPFLEPAE